MKWGQQREMALDVWVKVALEKETMQWPTSVLRSLKVRLIHPGFHGHIPPCHLALKECGNLLVVSGLVSLRYSYGLPTWLTCKHRLLLCQGSGYPDQHMNRAHPKAYAGHALDTQHLHWTAPGVGQ